MFSFAVLQTWWLHNDSQSGDPGVSPVSNDSQSGDPEVSPVSNDSQSDDESDKSEPLCCISTSARDWDSSEMQKNPVW